MGMEITVTIDESCREPRIVIFTDRVTDEIDALIKRIRDDGSDTLPVHSPEGVRILGYGDIIRIYAENKRVLVQTDGAIHSVNARLYELEERLDPRMFARISNSEIINVKRIVNLDISMAGTISVLLQGGIRTFVSRRNVSRIKRTLGI